MLEPWRSHYLRAIGVDVYLPRYPLSAAAPSIELVWDDVDEEPAVDPPLVAEHLQPISPRSVPPAAIPAIAKEAPRGISTDSPARTTPTNKAPIAQIKLLVAVSDGGVLVLDDIPQPAQRPHTLRLLSNLLFATERKAVNLTAEQFEWPLPNLRNRQVSLDEPAARETLNGFLTKKILSENISVIYLLGEAAAYWVSENQRNIPGSGHQLSWKVSVSALAVLRDPRLKQRWWQDLRSAMLTH